jgi:hypothetical protein
MSMAPTAREIYLSPRPGRAEERDELEREFFRNLRLPNGVFKTTSASRLGELDEVVNDLLPRDGRLRLMDVAVSSGVTTGDWIESLEAAGVEHEMYASDLIIWTVLVSSPKHLHVLMDRTGCALQYDLFGLGVRAFAGKRWLDLPLAAVRNVVRGWVRRHPIWEKSPAIWEVPDASEAEEHAPVLGRLTARRVSLISHKLTSRKDVTLLEEDLLEPCPESLRGRFHAVRAANILNQICFSEEQARAIVASLRARLADDGLLAVCHTQESGSNNASVFRLGADRRFTCVATLGDGAGRDHLILEESA